MNLTQLERLPLRIAVRLKTAGPATLHKLATELEMPRSDVEKALKTLQQTGLSVKRLPFGFWDVTNDTENVA